MAQTTVFIYNCFFHYKDSPSLNGIFEWLDTSTLRYVAATEHEDHINLTKKHLQVILAIPNEWTKSMSNYWTTGAGAKYLQKVMIPDAGSKKPKRWSQKQWHTGFDSGIEYVLKEADKASVIRSSDPLLDLTPFRSVWYEKHPKLTQTELPHKTKSFQQKILDYWKDNGSPRTERECMSLMCDYMSDHKWGYIADRDILRAARWIYSNAQRDHWKRGVMLRYDQNEIQI